MLSQATGYAALALGYVAAADGKPVLVKNIAAGCDIPAPYLAKIVNTLSRAGIVTTQRGIGGGVSLAKDPRQLTLLDLCVALDDPVLGQRCMLGIAECNDERACPAHQFNIDMRRRLLEFLSGKTLHAVSEFETGQRAKRRALDEAAAAAERRSAEMSTGSSNGHTGNGRIGGSSEGPSEPAAAAADNGRS